MKNLFQLYVFSVRIIAIFAFCSLGISNAYFARHNKIIFFAYCFS